MRIYSVHIRREGLDPDADIVLVKEGFSWPAALFMPLWALWRGLWLASAGMVLAVAAISAIATINGLGHSIAPWLYLGAALLSGYNANDLIRASLERRGFEMRDIIAAPNRDTAVFRFFDARPELAASVTGAGGEILP